jgi:uncharacterized protein (DUF2126 family)
VHAPLVFDIIDRWNDRVIGRCTYHVGAPDGRPYTTRPVNAAQAEDRRRARFQVCDNPLELIMPQEEEINPNFPMTLDLRLLAPIGDPRSEKRGLVS